MIMNLVEAMLLFVLASLIDLNESGCGSFSTLPLLALKTSTATNANSNGAFYIRIKTSSSWSTWRRIDNANCDDFEKGYIDYFNNFNDITDAWEGIAIYTCDTDGWNVDAIGFWNGWTMQWVTSFCKNIGGPGKTCGEDIVAAAGYCGDSTVPKYDRYWIDQNDKACPLVVVNLIAEGWFLDYSDPGTPTC